MCMSCCLELSMCGACPRRVVLSVTKLGACRYDERTELADQVNVRNVPMFQYYMNGKLVEQFATRDKARISLSIDKYVPGAVSL